MYCTCFFTIDIRLKLTNVWLDQSGNLVFLANHEGIDPKQLLILFCLLIYFIDLFFLHYCCLFLSIHLFLFLESTSTFECSGNLGDYIFISRSCEHKTLEPVASYIEHESRAYSTISRWINKYINRISGQKPHRGVHLKLVDSTNPICIGDRSSFLQWWPSTPLFLFSFFFYLFSIYFSFFLSFQWFKSSPTRLDRKRSFWNIAAAAATAAVPFH